MNTLKTYFADYNKLGGIKELLVIALPMIISTACDGLMTFTDRMFLARLGTNEMNAAMGGGTTIQVFFFFFMGLIGYSNALVAQYFGSGDKRTSSVVLFQALLVVVVAYPVILLLKPLTFILFDFMQLSPTQLNLQLRYMNILAWGSFFSLLRFAMGCFFTGIGKPKVVMAATITALILNVLLDYMLIFGKFGCPAMGIEGAAVATVLGTVGACLVLFAGYFHRYVRIEFEVTRSFRFNWNVMKKLLYYGYPAGVEMLLSFMAFTLIILLFHSRGEVVATASTIMFSWDLMTFIPLVGIEIAVTSLVGRYMGAARPQVAHRAALSGIKMGVLFSAVVMVVFIAIPRTLVIVFSPDIPNQIFNESVDLAVNMIRIASLYVLAEAFMVALVGALRGAGDTHFTMYASVGLHWLLVLVLYISFKVFDVETLAAWSILVVAFLCFCWLLYFRFRSEKWKKINVLK